MTADQFATRWQEVYPETICFAHTLRHVYPDRWFRIHSLPDSKRYADTPAEWALLLGRQYALLTDLLGDREEILVVRGQYLPDDAAILTTALASDALVAFRFLPTGQRVDLHEFYPTDYEPGSFYDSQFSEQIWRPHEFDKLLCEVADYQLRGIFFISWHRACLIAPYDGGVDVILQDSATSDYYRERYRTWLSARPDGL